MHIRAAAVLSLVSLCAIVVCAPVAAPDQTEKSAQVAQHIERGREMFYRGARVEYGEMVAQAQREFEAAIAIDSQNVDAHRGLQNCRKFLGDDAQNLKAYKALLDAQPDNPEYIYLYTRLLESLQQRYDMMAAALPAHKDAYWLHYGLAIAKYKAGNDRSCVDSLEECIRIEPGRDEPYQLLINIYLIRAKNVEAALKVCERAIAKADAPAFAHAIAASILLADGKTEDALAHYNKAVELDPRNVAYRVQIATMLLDAGRKDDAGKHLRAAIDFGAGREGIDEAAKLAAAVFEIKWPLDNTQRADLRVAEQHIREGNYKSALSCVGDLLYQDKKIAIFHVCKARALVGLKQYDEAAASLDEAEKLEPQCADIYEVRARIALVAEKIEQARAMTQKAIDLNPYSQKAYLLLAAIDHSEKKFAAAVDDIAKHYSLALNFDESRLFLIDEARAPQGPLVHLQEVCGFDLKYYLSSVPTGDYAYIRWIIHAEKAGRVVHTMFAEEVRVLDKKERKMITRYYLCDILDETNDVRRIDMGQSLPTEDGWREAAARHISGIYSDEKDE